MFRRGIRRNLRSSASTGAPANTVAPTLGGGMYAGSSPAITPGIWTGSPTLTYSLEVNGVEVASGTEAEVEAYVYAIADEGLDAQLREIPNGNAALQASSGTVRIWNPLEDSGIKLWLRADKGITLASTKVSAWVSQAGDASLAQATDATRPTFVSSDSNFNNRATVSFSPTQWLRDTSFTAIAQPYMMIVLCRVTAGVTNVVVDDGGATDAPALFYSSGTWKAASGANIDSSDATLTGVRAHLLDAVGDATSAYYISNFTTPKVTANAGTNAPNSMTIGANNSGAGGITGQIAEIIITSTRGQTQRNKYRDYLNAFYARSIV